MGFRVDHTLLMSMDVGLQGYSEERGQQFFKQLAERVRSLPGVRDAAIAAYIPMGNDNTLVNIYPEGQPVDDKSKTISAFGPWFSPAISALRARPLSKAANLPKPIPPRLLTSPS